MIDSTIKIGDRVAIAVENGRDVLTWEKPEWKVSKIFPTGFLDITKGDLVTYVHQSSCKVRIYPQVLETFQIRQGIEDSDAQDFFDEHYWVTFIRGRHFHYDLLCTRCLEILWILQNKEITSEIWLDTGNLMLWQENPTVDAETTMLACGCYKYRAHRSIPDPDYSNQKFLFVEFGDKDA